jgi:hypothetical protein
MSNFKTQILFYLFLVLNNLYSIYDKTSKNLVDFYLYIRNYLNGHKNIWIFIPNHSIPIPLSYISNDIDYNWLYDNSSRTLYFVNNCIDSYIDNCKENTSMLKNNKKNHKFKISWLATKISIKLTKNNDSLTDDVTNNSDDFTDNIDKFIDELTIVTFPENIPTLSQVFMCWCVYSGNWFNQNDNINFIIFDEEGEEVTIPVNEDTNSIFRVKRNKLYANINYKNIANEISSPLITISDNKDKDV